MIVNNLKPLKFRGLVSIVFVLDGNDLKFNTTLFKNLREQTYKNVEYIFVYANNFPIEDFRKKLYEETDIDLSTKIRLIESEKNHAMFDIGIANSQGEVIFLRYTQPVFWNKGHIRAHLQYHEQKKFEKSFLLSFLELKALEINPEHPFGTVNYRITKKVDPNLILVDEMSFTKDVNISFKEASTYIDKDQKVVDASTPNAQVFFDPSKILIQVVQQTGSIEFCEEITVLTFVPTQQKQPQQVLSQPNWPNDQTLQVVDDDLSIRHCIPTLFGNTQLDEQWNNKIREYIKKYWNDIKTRTPSRIIVKRMIGMGDVIETSGVVEYLKKEFPSSELWYVTSNTRGSKEIVECFTYKPDYIIAEDEQHLFTDLLGYQNLPNMLEKHGYDKTLTFDLRLDLDCAYESRPTGVSFAKAYYDVLGITDQSDFYTLKPSLTFDLSLRNTKNFIAVNLGGSGWLGRELEEQAIISILSYFKEHHYSLIHVSTVPERYENCKQFFDLIVGEDFEKMVQYTSNAIGYIGADSGPMHIARSQNIPILVWNGSALTEITSSINEQNYPLTIIKHEELECLGCKHKIFYNIIPIENDQYTITFAPNCMNNDQYACMKNFDSSYIQNKILEFEKTFAKNVNNYEKIKINNE